MRIADLLEFAFLQHTEQLHLQRRAHRPDFVQEQRAFVRLFEPALPVADGARERASHVAEDFGFEQRLGDCAAVQRDEAVHLPRAVVVDRARDHFLAAARFPRHENRAVGRGHGFEELKQLLHRPALPDDAFETIAFLELGTKVRVLGLQSALLERRIEHVQELVDLKWLADEVEGAAFDRADGVLRRAVAGDDNGDYLGIAADRRLYQR